jgi:hypothetical protein
MEKQEKLPPMKIKTTGDTGGLCLAGFTGAVI